jgi:uncharacterized protein (TIGR04255 family)
MNWEPAHADHSIDNVLAVIAFEDAVDANTFDEIVVSVRKVAAEHQLTTRVDIQEPVLPPGLVPGQVIFDTGNLAFRRRVAFQRVVNNASIAEFSVGMQNIGLSTSRYTKWSDFRAILLKLTNSMAAHFPLSSKVKSIQLQYTDRFDSTIVGADFFEVISKSSPFVPIAATKRTRALHVHSGWFDYSGPGERTLTNINIDIVDNSEPAPPDAKTKITLLTFARLDALSGTIPDPFERLTALHGYLKNVFGETITREAAARVALND